MNYDPFGFPLRPPLTLHCLGCFQGAPNLQHCLLKTNTTFCVLSLSAIVALFEFGNYISPSPVTPAPIRRREWMDGRTDGWTDRQMDGWTNYDPFGFSYIYYWLSTDIVDLSLL
ncbi:hypothetical protein CHARACLAT_001349 [Characodon lateralis]|uniref:Uncharacterized protein n=1 Tax=Characodon lateralis TaxID=208331 RepID=A0ABU7DCZ8_9TELE|nr:hypothetical protein [Characodon lateralis]